MRLLRAAFSTSQRFGPWHGRHGDFLGFGSGQAYEQCGKNAGARKQSFTEELIRSVDGVADDRAWSLKWYLEATAEKPFKDASLNTPVIF